MIGLGIGLRLGLDDGYALSQAIIRAYSGSLYIPNDANCFQDSAGTTPCTKDSVVGLLIDQGRGGLSALGPDVQMADESDLSTAQWVKYNATVSGNLVTATGQFGNVCPADGQTPTASAGDTYKIEVDAEWVSGNKQLSIVFKDSGFAGNNDIRLNALDFTSGPSRKVFTFIKTWVGSSPGVFNAGVQDRNASGWGSFRVHRISVFKFPSGTNNAIQGTTGYKPILRKGAKNLLKSSEAYDPACWGEFSSGTATISTNPEVGAPDGIVSSVKFAPNDDGAMYFGPFLPQTAGVTYTATYYVRIDSGTLSANLRITNAPVTLSSTWQKFTETLTEAATRTRQYGIYLGSTSVPIYFVAQIEVGPTASPYAATTSAPASNGIGPWWLDFDGSDDVLAAGAFGAGFASSTLVRSNYGAVQTTTTGQDLSAGYNMTVDNSGLIVVPDTVSASDLAVLQRYANSLGGYSA